MKKLQWYVILGIVFALIVAIFAVVNVDQVDVNYVFGTAHWPLILVILGSVAMGGIIVGSVMAVRIISLTKQLKEIRNERIGHNELDGSDLNTHPKS
jgi:putative membrane protein